MTEEDYVKDLIERVKPYLPIIATPGKAMIKEFRLNDQSSIKVKKGMKLKLTYCHYLGSEGGLAFTCETQTTDDKHVLIASITHLRLEDTSHPFYKELRAYKLGRSQWLAMNHRSPVINTFP